jgi:hypothetical protein
MKKFFIFAFFNFFNYKCIFFNKFIHKKLCLNIHHKNDLFMEIATIYSTLRNKGSNFIDRENVIF